LIGGVDISFVSEENQKEDVDACAALVILEFPSLKLLYTSFQMVKLTAPYIPGFLAFREVEFIVELINKLKRDKPNLVPQMILVDGNGILHPRGFGLASHLGVLSGIPSIGVAKTLMRVDGVSRRDVMPKCRDNLLKKGDVLMLKGKSGQVWGVALRCSDYSARPVFVSIGYGVSLQTAVSITLQSCIHRISEPIRRADLGSRRLIRRWQNDK